MNNKTIIIIIVLIIAVLQYKLWLAPSGMRHVWKLQQQVQTQADKNQALQDRNIALAAEVNDLKHGQDAIEERARQDLGMVKKDEVFYRFVKPMPGKRDRS